MIDPTNVKKRDVRSYQDSLIRVDYYVMREKSITSTADRESNSIAHIILVSVILGKDSRGRRI